MKEKLLVNVLNAAAYDGCGGNSRGCRRRLSIL
jgi:hypothetical protein